MDRGFFHHVEILEKILIRTKNGVKVTVSFKSRPVSALSLANPFLFIFSPGLSNLSSRRPEFQALLEPALKENLDSFRFSGS